MPINGRVTMRMRGKIFPVAVACALALAGAAGAQTVKEGVEAWRAGQPQKAVAIWRSLADRGNADAAFNLGQAYRLGRGIPADAAQAKRWFQKAAAAGHLDAQVSLGLLLFDAGDRDSGLAWLQKAAQRGEPRAMLVVGTALFNGDGIARDPVRGYALVSRAAAQGLQPAKVTLADMDRILSLEDRKRGVAMAMVLAKTGTAKPTGVAGPAKAPPRPVATPVAKEATTLPPAPVTKGGWGIQLGAFGSRGAAQALAGKLSGRLGGRAPRFVPVGSMVRLQIGPFANRAEAAAACARLAPQPCFPVSW